MKKEIKNSIFRCIAILLFIGIIFSTALFFIGFHNLDLGQNGMRMELMFNTSLIDYNGYNKIGMDDMYINGVHQMIISFLVMFISALNFPNFKKYL